MLAFNSLVIASDHGGVELKTCIISHFQDKLNVIDMGTNDPNVSVDYPDYAKIVCQSVIKNQLTCGVLICKSGIGMSIAANKIRGMRALLSYGNKEIVKLSRQHNNCNVICFGADYIANTAAINAVNMFIHTKFLNERHQRRLDKIE